MEIENCANSTFNLDYDQYPLSEESVTRVKKKSEKKKVDTITTDFAEKYNGSGYEQCKGIHAQ